MAYPTGTPVAERVLVNLQAVLQAIAGAPSYKTTVVSNGVFRNAGDNPLSLKQWPAILIVENDVVEDENSAWPMVECDATLTLRCALQMRTGIESALRDFAADVKMAVRQNYRLPDGGGDVALVAFVTGEAVFQSDGASPIGVVDVPVRIRYRYLFEDPNTPI